MFWLSQTKPDTDDNWRNSSSPKEDNSDTFTVQIVTLGYIRGECQCLTKQHQCIREIRQQYALFTFQISRRDTSPNVTLGTKTWRFSNTPEPLSLTKLAANAHSSTVVRGGRPGADESTAVTGEVGRGGSMPGRGVRLVSEG